MTDVTPTPAPVVADPNASPAPAANWLDSLPENAKGVAALKGWKEPAQAVESYANLERLFGADKAGRTVAIPGEKATPEEVAAFRTKLGVPTDVAGYEFKFPDNFPDPEFGKVAAPLLHKHGIPKAAAEGLIQDFAAQVQASETARVAEETKRFTTELSELKNEFGANFDQKMELGKRAFAKTGMPPEVMDLIEDALHDKGKPGTAAMLRWAASLGEMLGEGKFIDGDKTGAFEETHDQLLAQRKALYADPAWAKRFHENEPAARDQQKALEAKIAEARRRLPA
jgi:hypothetical protein